jgi:transporter family protein
MGRWGSADEAREEIRKSVGDVATVTLIDKGSVVVAMLLASLVLREVITLRLIAGAGLIVAELLVIAKKP